jgi:hypothetical protein
MSCVGNDKNYFDLYEIMSCVGNDKNYFDLYEIMIKLDLE